MNFFNTQIHSWYALFKRDLPWRSSHNPYFIWLSEIILQQTRIDQGLSYYLRFTDEFPTVNDLANASEDQILKLWQGLGYYSRARNLHFTAKYICQNYNGEFPNDYNSILSLKGIGEYTASAIASISFNLEYPAVDGNVYRVLSRFFGLQEPIDSNSGKKAIYELARELIKGTDPGMHNQAVMEFGALQCIPRNPDCIKCPLSERCYAFSFGKVTELPVKLKKTKQRDRYFNYLVMEWGKYTWLQKRIENDIWKNLFEFPVVETTEETSIKQIASTNQFQKLIDPDNSTIVAISDWKVHILSHQRIHYRFIRINLGEDIIMSDTLIRVYKEEIFNFAVPRLLEIYINNYW